MNYEVGKTIKDRVYMIDPQKIVLAMKEEFSIHTHHGKVLDGDWEIVPFSQKVDFYDSYAQRIRKNTPWEETEYFKRVMAEIYQGVSKWGCKNREQFLRRCSELDGIYRNMKENGYRQSPEVDCIEVNIDARGRLIFNNGRHRLVFAKLLNIPEIPVKVTVRHSQWIKFKEEIQAYQDSHGGYLYAPLCHPDLDHYNPLHTGRFQLLNRYINPESKTLLDIGAHWGYMCGRFEETGRECFAVENEPVHLYFLKRLKEANQNKFHIIQQDICDYIETVNRFDTVLALSVFHHFIKTPDSFEKFKRLLKRLDAGEMFFQGHNPGENQMKKSYRNFEPDDFARFILQHTSFSDYERIGDFGGRMIYRLYR